MELALKDEDTNTGHEERMSEKVDRLQAELLRMDLPEHDNEPPVTNHFGPNIYMREILMKANDHKFVIGCRHKTRHYNIVLTGRASVLMDDEGTWEEIKAPAIFMSEAGVKKVLVVHEDMRWVTVHPLEKDYTEEDMLLLEEKLTEEPPTQLHEEARTQRILRRKEMEKLSRRKSL